MRKIPPVKAVIFDIGNVLIRWDPRNAYAPLFQNRKAELDFFLNEVCNLNWHGQHDRGVAFDENIRSLQGQFPEFHDMIGLYEDIWDNMFNGTIEGSVEILRQLHALDTPLYAISNFPAEKYAEFRKSHNFMALFKDVIISGEEKITKPDPRIYQILLDRHSLSPETSLFIDDRDENLHAAEKLGLQTHLFTDADKLRLFLFDRDILRTPLAGHEKPFKAL